MKKKPLPKKTHPPFIFKISKYSKDRLHVEVPARSKKHFHPGEPVEIKKFKRTKG